MSIWAFAWMAGAGNVSAGETIDLSETLTLEEIHPGIWLHVSQHTLSSGDLFPANGLAIRQNDGWLLIDSPWGVENTTALLDHLRAESGLPVKSLIGTHFHADSLGDPGLYAAQGVPVHVGPWTAALLPDEATRVQALVGMELTSKIALQGLEVYYPGPAHSTDNVVVYHRDSGILFGGCAVRSPVYPGAGNTADGDTGNWADAIRQVKNEFPEAVVVVPGHGPVGDASLLDYTVDVFASQREVDSD